MGNAIDEWDEVPGREPLLPMKGITPYIYPSEKPLTGRYGYQLGWGLNQITQFYERTSEGDDFIFQVEMLLEHGVARMFLRAWLDGVKTGRIQKHSEIGKTLCGIIGAK